MKFILAFFFPTYSQLIFQHKLSNTHSFYGFHIYIYIYNRNEGLNRDQEDGTAEALRVVWLEEGEMDRGVSLREFSSNSLPREQ